MASIVAVIGLSLTLWNINIKLGEIESGEELRQQQIRNLRLETGKIIEEWTEFDRGVGAGCWRWEQELLKLMIDNRTGMYTIKAIQNIPQTERDSYHELCKDHNGLLYQHVDEYLSSACNWPRFTNGSLINATVVDGKLVATGNISSQVGE